MAKKNIDYSKLQLGNKKPIRKLAEKKSIAAADIAVQQIHQTETEVSPPKAEKERTKRVTLDIPISLHAEIRKKTFDMGITMKKYFLDLAKEDL